MKLNHFALVNGSKIDSFGRRKRERESTRIDTAIKAALDELDHHAQGWTAFLSIVGCIRGRTSLLKPTSGRGIGDQAVLGRPPENVEKLL